MTKIILYQFEECPYCTKVRNYMDEHKIEYEKVNVSYDREDQQRKELMKKSGIGTVPVIKYGDKYVGDSEEIIAYLESRS